MEIFKTLIELIQYRTEKSPYETAYIFLQDGEHESERLTYQQLNTNAKCIAAYLQSQDAKNKRALLLYQPGLDFIAAFLGCIYSGVVAVPVCPPKRNRRFDLYQAIARDSEAELVLTTSNILNKLDKKSLDESKLLQLNYIVTDKIPISLATNWYSSLLSEKTLAFLQYTSGSTGTPKGVMISHENLLHNQQLICDAFSHTDKSVILGWLPFHHDMGLVGNLLQPLYLGRPCILMPPMAFISKPSRWLQAISRYRATTSGGPNFSYDLCVRKITSGQMKNLDLSCWKVAFNGAEPINANTLSKFASVFAPYGFDIKSFYPCYGMAETTLIVTGGLITSTPKFKSNNEDNLEESKQEVNQNLNTSTKKVLVGCGSTLGDQKIKIVDPENLCECSPNEIGEIWISGKSVSKGYWNKKDETIKAFNAYLDIGNGPFFRTGDMGFIHQGELYVTGRLKELIIIRGKNYYPNDIELTIQKSNPSIFTDTSAVFDIDIENEKKVIVVQEVQRNFIHKIDISNTIADIRESVLQTYELRIDDIVLVKPGSIPKTSSGKVQRFACRDNFMSKSLKLIKKKENIS